MTTKLSDLHALSNFELRKVIAEMLGWKYRQSSPDPKKYFCRVAGNDNGWWKKPGEKDWFCAYCHHDNPPLWPESIEAAFSLIEDLLDKNYSFSLLDLSSVPDRYMMHVRQRGSARILHYATAPTAARAICEAYVMTMQGEEG